MSSPLGRTCIAATLLLASPAAAAPLTLIGFSSEDAVMLDPGSIHRSPDGHANAQLYVVPRERLSNGAAYLRVEQEFDCSGRAFRVRQILAFDEDDAPVRTRSQEPAVWRPVGAATAASRGLEAACTGAVPNRDLQIELPAGRRPGDLARALRGQMARPVPITSIAENTAPAPAQPGRTEAEPPLAAASPEAPGGAAPGSAAPPRR
jgi:hypothetical protein